MRRAAAWSGLALLVVLGLAVVLWAALPRIIEDQATDRLSALGLSPVRLSVEEIGFDRIVLSDVWITPSLRAERVTVTFDALARSLESLTIDGADLAFDLRDGQIRANGLETLPETLGGSAESTGTPQSLSLPVGRVQINDLTIYVATPEDNFVASGDLRAIDQGNDHVDLSGHLTARNVGVSAHTEFDISLRRPLPWAVTGTATLAAQAKDARLPGLAYGVDGTLRASLRSDGEGSDITIDPGARMSAAALAPALRDRLPAALLEAMPLPWRLTVSGIDDTAPHLSAAPTGAAEEAVRLATAGEVLFEAAAGRIVLRGDGATTIHPAGAVRDMSITSVTLEATGLRLQDTTWTVFASMDDLTGVPLLAEARDSRLVIEAEDVAVANLSTPRASLSLSGPLTWSGFGLLFATDDGLLEAEGPLHLGAVTLPRGLQWPLKASGEGTGLAVALAPDGAVTLAPDLTVSQPQALLHLGGGAEGATTASDPPLAVDAAFAEGRVSGVIPLPDGPALELRTHLADGTVTLDGQGFDGMAVEGVNATLSMTPQATRLNADAALPRLPGEPAELPADARSLRPYRVAVEATAGTDRQAVRFAATASDAQGREIVTVDGRHNLSAGDGEADVALPERTFTQDGPQPADYYVPLARGGTRVTGTLGAKGRISWSDQGLRPRLDVLLKDAVISRGFLTLDRVNGVIRLTNLWPPRTPAGQTLAVAAIRAGLPLTDALATFRLDGQGRLLLDKITMQLAEGTLEAGPAELPLDASAGALTIDVTGMDLRQLIELIDLSGLTATGTLDGTVPVRLEQGALIITDGRLTAREDGRIRYAPETPPAALAGGGQSTQLLLQALADFRYEALSLTLNGSAAGDMDVALHIEGANPDLYDGYPVEFNLTVSGALSQIIADALRGYRVPDRIRERIQGFSASP